GAAMKAVFAGLVIAAMAAAEGRAQTSVDFICADGSRFTLEVLEAGAATLKARRGAAIHLRNRNPAQGLWYASDEGEIRERGDGSTTIQIGGQSPLTCRPIGQ